MYFQPINKDEFDFIAKREIEQLKMFESDHSRCWICGAELPDDVGFCEYHMLREHGLAV